LKTTPNEEPKTGLTEEASDRREAVRKLGRFAAYAAPFTLLAFTQKANAGWSGHGPVHSH